MMLASSIGNELTEDQRVYLPIFLTLQLAIVDSQGKRSNDLAVQEVAVLAIHLLVKRLLFSTERNKR